MGNVFRNIHVILELGVIIIIYTGARSYIFTEVCIKKKKGGHFWGAKSESRVSAPFFASKTV
jgi:hypothetical protein